TAKAADITTNLTIFDFEIAADVPAQLLKSLLEDFQPNLCFGIIRSEDVEHAYEARTLCRLRKRGQRPRDDRTSNSSDEIAPAHGDCSQPRWQFSHKHSTRRRHVRPLWRGPLMPTMWPA